MECSVGFEFWVSNGILGIETKQSWKQNLPKSRIWEKGGGETERETRGKKEER